MGQELPEPSIFVFFYQIKKIYLGTLILAIENVCACMHACLNKNSNIDKNYSVDRIEI